MFCKTLLHDGHRALRRCCNTCVKCDGFQFATLGGQSITSSFPPMSVRRKLRASSSEHACGNACLNQVLSMQPFWPCGLHAGGMPLDEKVPGPPVAPPWVTAKAQRVDDFRGVAARRGLAPPPGTSAACAAAWSAPRTDAYDFETREQADLRMVGNVCAGFSPARHQVMICGRPVVVPGCVRARVSVLSQR